MGGEACVQGEPVGRGKGRVGKQAEQHTCQVPGSQRVTGQEATGTW